MSAPHLSSVATTLLLAMMPAIVSASCYSIYDTTDAVVYRSSLTPIDLSQPISQEMARRFPAGHRLLITEDMPCDVFRPSLASPAVFLYGNPIVGTSGGTTPSPNANAATSASAQTTTNAATPTTAGV